MSSVAYLNLRNGVPERREAFINGLSRIGYKVVNASPAHKPKIGDIFVTWNRIGASDAVARSFESKGCAVIVVENASWGNDFIGDRWYHISKKYHNVNGAFYIGDDERWDSIGVELSDWRDSGETVILMQRGIGPRKTRMPPYFRNYLKKNYPGIRIRQHPGTKKAISLDDDLSNAGKVITWGSGAAIKALMMGIKVESHMPNWIGEQDNTDEGRLAMFRRLSWAQWRLSEIDSGTPFMNLL